jgi:hypothetical protein
MDQWYRPWQIIERQMIFFKNSNCRRWYIQYSSRGDDIYVCRPIIILSGWLSSSMVDYHPQWLSIIYRGWLSSPVVEHRVNSHHLPTWINIVLLCRKSAVDEHLSRQMIIICFNWISSTVVEYQLLLMNIILHSRQLSATLHYLLLQFNIIHTGNKSTIANDNQPQRMIKGRQRLFIVFHRWI